MDPHIFSISLEKSAAVFISLLLQDLDLPRSQAFNFVHRVEHFLQQDSIKSSFMYFLQSLEELGGPAVKLAAFANMVQKLQKLFRTFFYINRMPELF